MSLDASGSSLNSFSLKTLPLYFIDLMHSGQLCPQLSGRSGIQAVDDISSRILSPTYKYLSSKKLILCFNSL